MELLGKAPYDYHVFLIYMRGYGESDHIFDDKPHDYTKIWGEDVIAFAEKMAWAENWPTQNPDRLARRAHNHEEHLEILMHRKKEEFLIKNSSMMACEVESEEEFYEKLAQIPFPVMILNGVLDPIEKVEDCLKIAKMIPGAQLLTYQHLGHGGPDECPELVARDCDRFFKDTQGRIL